MNLSSKHLESLVEHFSSLPGIGKKTALRLVLNLLKKNDNDIQSFAKDLFDIKTNIKSCKICHHISDFEICSICSDLSRQKETICVVEDIRDIMAIESTEQYFGLYHVLGGVISPMDGIGPNDLNILSLLDRIEKENISEVILALNATMEGDTTNFYIFRKLAEYNIKITTLSRGVSFGTELHYTDELTLGRSIINRMPFDFSFVKK